VTATLTKTRLLTLSATVVVTATIRRTVQKSLSATVSVSAAITKAVLKRLTASPVSVVASLIADYLPGGVQVFFTRFFGSPRPDAAELRGAPDSAELTGSPDAAELRGSPDDDQFGPPNPRRT
jgi:hypothetical protein